MSKHKKCVVCLSEPGDDDWTGWGDKEKGLCNSCYQEAEEKGLLKEVVYSSDEDMNCDFDIPCRKYNEKHSNMCGPFYHERQSGYKCAYHAVNNAMGIRWIPWNDAKKMNAYADLLLSDRVNEWLNETIKENMTLFNKYTQTNIREGFYYNLDAAELFKQCGIFDDIDFRLQILGMSLHVENGKLYFRPLNIINGKEFTDDDHIDRLIINSDIECTGNMGHSVAARKIDKNNCSKEFNKYIGQWILIDSQSQKQTIVDIPKIFGNCYVAYFISDKEFSLNILDAKGGQKTTRKSPRKTHRRKSHKRSSKRRRSKRSSKRSSKRKSRRRTLQKTRQKTNRRKSLQKTRR
jgi:hypothetical protein